MYLLVHRVTTGSVKEVLVSQPEVFFQQNMFIDLKVHRFKGSTSPDADISGVTACLLKSIITVSRAPVGCYEQVFGWGIFPDSLKICRESPYLKEG